MVCKMNIPTGPEKIKNGTFGNIKREAEGFIPGNQII